MPWIPRPRERLSQKLGRQLASRLVIPQLSCRWLGWCSCVRPTPPDRACRRHSNQLSTIPAASAGTDPGPRVHARAVARTRRHGLDLAGHRPADLADVLSDGGWCATNAHEELDPRLPRLHWSIPDLVRVDTDAAFEDAYANIGQCVHRLANLTRS